MPIATHLVRRGRYYSWRRKSGGIAVQISLNTCSPATARRLAVAMTAASERVWDDMISGKISKDGALAAMRASLMGQSPVFSDAQSAAIPEEAESHSHIDPMIRPAADRLVRELLRDGLANRETCDAIIKTAALIEEATGVSDLRKMRQHHVVALRDMLDRLPPSYRKSSRERDMPLAEIAERAEKAGKKVGLSAGTTNRVLQIFQQIVARAGNEGIEIDPKLKPTALRRRKSKRAREERLAFSHDQMTRIFSAPTWTGCASSTRRHEHGDEVIKDALYWLPLIAAYTGARREEIAGLMKRDLRQEDGVWCFFFDENEERSIKTESSIRRVPVHPHLLELGILENRGGTGRLFPSIYRKSSKSQLGECIDYNWRKIMRETLDPAELDRRCFHSFRHSTVDALGKMRDIRDRVIKDILGHTPTSITDRVYGSDAEPEEMLEAIQRLPRVF